VSLFQLDAGTQECYSRCAKNQIFRRPTKISTGDELINQPILGILAKRLRPLTLEIA
jgi:hypothetical protein